jgi:hypothetical protein
MITFLRNGIGWSICPYDQLILKEYCVIDMFLNAKTIMLSLSSYS